MQKQMQMMEEEVNKAAEELDKQSEEDDYSQDKFDPTMTTGRKSQARKTYDMNMQTEGNINELLSEHPHVMTESRNINYSPGPFQDIREAKRPPLEKGPKVA